MSILYTIISKDPNIVLAEFTEYEGDLKKITSLALEDVKKNKKIYRNIGK